jgi:hypothetical protein
MAISTAYGYFYGPKRLQCRRKKENLQTWNGTMKTCIIPHTLSHRSRGSILSIIHNFTL